ncbi:MAG: hypothetical protein HY069_01655 [Chlamydiia bacterium]|nr:hypothetical protein [Chlamydiia bacterium]
MRKCLALIFLLPLFLLGAADFDCVVIGTSPISMLEAISRAFSGEKVLLLDQAAEAGGAWKSIRACDISHVDMGCHQLVGSTPEVKAFLEKYVGCKMVPMEKPFEMWNGHSEYYFSRGCYELIHNLEKIIAKTPIVYLLNHSVDTVFMQGGTLTVEAQGKRYTTHRIITVPSSFFNLEGILPKRTAPQPSFNSSQKKR